MFGKRQKIEDSAPVDKQGLKESLTRQALGSMEASSREIHLKELLYGAMVTLLTNPSDESFIDVLNSQVALPHPDLLISCVQHWLSLVFFRLKDTYHEILPKTLSVLYRHKAVVLLTPDLWARMLRQLYVKDEA